jgi:hypothetical protein
MSDIQISDQTSEIFANLLKYYNGCNDIKCKIDDSQINNRIRNFYKAVKGDEKLKNYLLKRNKLLFYKNKSTEILPKINLYAYFKGEDREEVVEKIWDNLTLIYLSIEESLETKDQELVGNLSKSLEGGSLGKLMDNLQDELKDMNVNGMFEKLKANSTPESKTKATNLLTEMITKLTNNMGDISKSANPGDSLMSNLKDLAQDYSKMFESGQLDFGSFLSAIPDILQNPEELTKNIDTSKLEGLNLPDISKLIDPSKLSGESGALNGLAEQMGGLSGLMSGQGGAEGAMGAMGGLSGLMNGKLGESLNNMMGGKLNDIMASVIENQGASMLEKMAKEAEEKQNQKPLTDEQIKELEDYLKNQKLDMD